MEFNDHDKLKNKHAFLSPSNYSWINYDADKLERTYRNSLAKEKGVRLHALACECIKLGVKLPNNKTPLNMFVNDAIGYRMAPEQILYYSDNCFGTADAICYQDGLLRIHDLKTGAHPASMAQLEVYAALFFLEYGGLRAIRFDKTDIELRIYQRSEVSVLLPDKRVISDIMGKIQTFDKLIQELKGD